MIEIIPCRNRFDELIQFVTRLNNDGAHDIGFFGEGEADGRAPLAECLIPPAEGFRLAYEGDHLVGIFGVDADPEINRAWLFGSLVEHEDWHTIADQLYAEVLPLIPADIHDYDLFCDVQNTEIETFALKHGFPLSSENAVLTMRRENYKPFTKSAQRSPHIRKISLSNSRSYTKRYSQTHISPRGKSLKGHTRNINSFSS